MRNPSHIALVLCVFAVALVLVDPLSAQEPSVDLKALESQVKDAAIAGHNAWMLTSTALVLFMTAPGLAMFYGGLVRKKNVLSVMMQCLYLMSLNTVIWGIYGYSLSFGGNDAATIGSKANPYIGNTDYLFMR